MNSNHSFASRFYGKVDELAVKIRLDSERHQEKKSRRKAEAERRNQAYIDGIWRGFR